MPAGLALSFRIRRLRRPAPLALGSGFYDLYLRRIRCQASLISKTTVITMGRHQDRSGQYRQYRKAFCSPRATMPVNVQSAGLFQGRFKIQIRPLWPVPPASFTGAEIRIVLACREPAMKLPRRTFLHQERSRAFALVRLIASASGLSVTAAVFRSVFMPNPRPELPHGGRQPQLCKFTPSCVG
jgi:hypothetical protein